MKKRSLFAAVAMLIVSAIVLTSATYAWFAASSQATISKISATVTNADGSVLLVPNKWALTDNGRGWKLDPNGGKQSTAPTVVAATAPSTSLTDANFNPFPTQLKPISFQPLDTGISNKNANKIGYDSLNFSGFSGATANGQVNATEGDNVTYSYEPGDYINYSFYVRYKGVTGENQYVTMTPKLEGNGADFGYVLVRVKPVVKDSNAQQNGTYKGSAGDVTDFWYAYDTTGNVYPDSVDDAKKLYEPLIGFTADSIADDKQTAVDDGVDDYMKDIVDSTDADTGFTLGNAIVPTQLATSNATAKVWDSTEGEYTNNAFKVIDSGITYNDTYNAEVEVFIWAEGNDPQCSGSVDSAEIGVSFTFDLVG